MKKIILLSLSVVLVACSKSINSLDVPNVHFPAQVLSNDLLKNYMLSYCWQYPEGRHSQNNQSDKEVVVVVSTGDGVSKDPIRNPYNLRKNAPDFYTYKSACIEKGNNIRYIGHAITWRPRHSALTFTSGSDPYLTDFDYYEITEELKASQKDFPVTRKEYGGYFGEPRGIYWSPDGQQFATLGIDVGLESSGANIWVYDIKNKTMVRVTTFKDIGEHVVNASWSQNGELLAVGYGEDNGVGIAEFNNGNVQNFSYIEITSNTNSQMGKWPYVSESIFSLILDKKNALYNRYLFSVSRPVWINNDKQLIFTAADESQLSTLFVVNSDGSDLKKLLPNLTGNIYLPELSPNGQILAFVRYPSWKDRTRAEIGVVNLLTKEVKSLIVMPASDDGSDLLVSGMAWSPDSKYLAFSSNYQGESDIYIMSANGESLSNLTEEISGNAVSPVWKP